MFFPANKYQRQTDANLNRRPLVFWLLAVVVTLLFVSLIIIAPLAQATHHNRLALTIYQSFSLMCHQIPERSFFIAGHKFAVCARCTGLYFGFAAILLAYPLFRSLRSTSAPPRKWLFIAAFPLLIDFSLTFVGLWENTHTTRLVTGLLLGGVTVLYVMPGLSELSLRRKQAPLAKQPKFTLSAEAIAGAPSDYSAPERRI